MTPDTLAGLAATLRAEGGLLGEAVIEPAPVAPGDSSALPEGAVRARAVAAIREGFALHAPGAARGAIVATDDPDLALLAGDRLYALGLAELAEDGDLPAVRILAEVIAASAAARGGGDPAAAEQAWEQGFRHLAHAPGPAGSADR